MNTQDILTLANDCAYIRNYVHDIKFNSNMLGDDFSRVCKHLNYYKRINAWLVVHHNQGKSTYVAHMNQLISRAPKIRFW